MVTIYTIVFTVYDIFYNDEIISNDAQRQTDHRIEKTDLVFSGTCKNCLKN